MNKIKTKKQFTPLGTSELENTFAGKRVIQRYMENGIIKVRIIEVKD